MNQIHSNQGIIFVKDTEGNMLKMETLEQFEVFLKSDELAKVNVTRLLWESLQEAFRSGKRVGIRKGWEAAAQEHGFRNPYER